MTKSAEGLRSAPSGFLTTRVPQYQQRIEGVLSRALQVEGGATDLLINFTYRQAFNDAFQQLGLASAIAMLIFVVVGTVSAYGFRLTRRLEEIGS